MVYGHRKTEKKQTGLQRILMPDLKAETGTALVKNICVSVRAVFFTLQNETHSKE